MIEIRPEVARFALAMEEVLRQNDHKGGWRDCSLDYLVGRLQDEFHELMEAVRGKDPDIRKEAVDLANFSMMIWDILDRP